MRAKNVKTQFQLLIFGFQIHPMLAKNGGKERSANKKPQGRPPAKDKAKAKGKWNHLFPPTFEARTRFLRSYGHK